jgi:hypothetical protein
VETETDQSEPNESSPISGSCPCTLTKVFWSGFSTPKGQEDSARGFNPGTGVWPFFQALAPIFSGGGFEYQIQGVA